MRLFLSALESSANIHAREVVRELLALLDPESKLDSRTTLEISGVFDPSLLTELHQGAIKLAPSYHPRDFSIMGFSDVAVKLPFLWRAQRELAEVALEADVIMLMDSSSFHIRLSKRIRAMQPPNKRAKIYYYILPQLWAWKSYRAKILERYCDRLLGILPFEAEYYSKQARESGQLVYVGHPLLDELESSLLDSRVKSKATPASSQSLKPCIVFMPGSRRGEIRRIFPTFYAVARELPNAKKLLVIPSTFAQDSSDMAHLQAIYETDSSTKGALQDFTLCFDTRSALMQADFAFICSGTATLEAALLGVPFVLGYRAAWLDYYIARCFVHLRYIGLANIFYNALCGEKPGCGSSTIHQELIQGSMSVENLLRAYHQSHAQDFTENAYKLRTYLKHGSARNVAALLAEHLA
ncbi:lipid-A-disaccharide synthase [Helicobacter canis]|uniref:Lipid-A-disaccharide synthase n=1 Tax=Helicobacter canis NCTC 12740 TaxID=1357399 RepID=V8CK81_9HELI|nr:lipid-A-disaccharide synthase [Helicobacter canis]ETD27472.1 lipid-A-disaccharide synthase [Helicobacter canis NCTC 12740]